MMGNKKWQPWYPLLFSLTIIAGMIIGTQFQNSKSGGFFGTNKTNVLQEAMELIQLKYVDKINTDTIQSKAIEGIMDELDPHSVYLSPVALKQANEDLEGNFEGIGVEFNFINDTVTVLYVIPNGPSQKAGLQIGDKLISVNDSSLVQKDISSEKIKSLIRGPLNSTAKLGIVRDNKKLNVEVTRGRIPVHAVDCSYMVDNVTGFIKLVRFSETSYEEFMQALENLQKQGMKKLILDLRGNGGGFMAEAVDMADEFLDQDKLIVYTEGENSKKKEYRCKRPGLFEKGTLILLVDELSASASEVLAGALQDWCRATIIGRRTFGKGLVQEQYLLNDGSAIRLTVARYYTPLGRSIQRSYEKGKKVYMDEIWERYNNGEMISEDSMKSHKGHAFLTNCSDTLFDGGGITPKYFVPLDTTHSNYILNMAISSAEYNSFLFNFYKNNLAVINGYKSVKEMAADKKLAASASLEWNHYLTSIKPKHSKKVTMKFPDFSNRILSSLARFRWGYEGYFQMQNTTDPMFLKSIEIANK
jgi:carboxyl-terminal processing protease